MEKKIDKDIEEPKKSHKILNLFLFLILLIIIIILYARYIGTKGLKVKEYKIESTNLPSSFSGIKIVHLSDLYLGNTTNINDLKKITEEINILKPDIIIFTGNLISSTYKINEQEQKQVTDLLNNMYSIIGKYIVKGHDDYNEVYDNIVLNTDFHILNNSSDIVYYKSSTPIFIGGLDYNEPNLNEMYNYYELNLEEKDYKANYKIILTSKSDNSESILENVFGADIILSGNSLNGSVNLPIYGPLFIPKGSKKYYLPYYKKNETQIFISSGIGTNIYPYRLFNRPSFNLYRLKSL